MTKAELIDKIAQSADVPKAEAGRVLDVALNAFKGALKYGQKITLVVFGTFSVSKRNPGRAATRRQVRLSRYRP